MICEIISTHATEFSISRARQLLRVLLLMLSSILKKGVGTSRRQMAGRRKPSIWSSVPALLPSDTSLIGLESKNSKVSFIIPLSGLTKKFQSRARSVPLLGLVQQVSR